MNSLQWVVAILWGGSCLASTAFGESFKYLNGRQVLEPVPGQFLSNSLEQDTFFNFVPVGSKIKIIEPGERVATGSVRANGKRQKVFKNEPLHNDMLRVSFSQPGAPEVGFCFLKDESGNVISQPDGYAIGNAERVFFGENLDVFSACDLKRFPSAREVVTIHTHPTFDLYFWPPTTNARGIWFYALSPGDIACSEAYSASHPEVVLTDIAVLPNGYFYLISYKAGQALNQ